MSLMSHISFYILSFSLSFYLLLSLPGIFSLSNNLYHVGFVLNILSHCILIYLGKQYQIQHSISYTLKFYVKHVCALLLFVKTILTVSLRKSFCLRSTPILVFWSTLSQLSIKRWYLLPNYLKAHSLSLSYTINNVASFSRFDSFAFLE